jgi:peptidoglycan/xylan/chitin deacetylase (PgdA/CDA1 family)
MRSGKCADWPTYPVGECPKLVQMRGKIRFPQVLMYHSISEPEGEADPLCTSPGRFEAQMLYLKRHNLRGVSMRELYLAMNMGDPRGLVGMTFDDGYEDFLGAAVPTLEKVGFSATVFVVAGMLGEESTWEHREGPTSRLRLLGADGVREVSERGMEVGSHSVTHPRLSGLDSETLIHEVRDSRQSLSEIVNAPVEGFCYPYGDLDGPAVRAARAAGYVYAVATKKQVEGGLYDWPRTYVGEMDSPLRLGVKLKVSPFLIRWRRRSLG